MTTSTAAPKRNPVTTALDRNWESHPILNTARTRKSRPLVRVTPATKVATSTPDTPAVTTAAPATAASPELGPIEIWRQVPKTA